jgi:hypothetical protein
MDRIDDANIAASQVLHHCPDGARFGWSDKKMHMIAHEHISVDFAASTRRRFGQASEIKPPVRFAEEAGSAVVATLDDVLRYVGQLQPRWAGHAPLTRAEAESAPPLICYRKIALTPL